MLYYCMDKKRRTANEPALPATTIPLGINYKLMHCFHSPR